ncbi:MAG: hypothetical protein ABJP49_14430 [Marinobacter alexandrii]|uniref:hypothetical protein n=1 Tax=Marinobacter alexandrii TaxID=2570351 RepID=UPI0032983664
MLRNTFGILSPVVGHAYRQWQQRMLSYRRGHYELNLERTSNRHNSNSRRGNHNNIRSGNYNSNRSNQNHSRNYRGNNGRSDNCRPITAGHTTTAIDSRQDNSSNNNASSLPPHRQR